MVLFTVYKTTHIASGKYYIGVHFTDNPHDEYLGSGKIIRRYVSKYGNAAFSKEILACFDERILAYRLEESLVTEETLSDPKCLNLKPGGRGGWLPEYRTKGATVRNQIPIENRTRENLRASSKRRWDSGLMSHINPVTFAGRFHTKQTKSAIGAANAIAQAGPRNSQFGTCWVTRDQTNRKIKREELEAYTTQGWSKGRHV